MELRADQRREQHRGVSEGGTNTLRIHPCWLRYVVAQGDFKSCVVDEIAAWYLLAQATGSASVATAA